MDQLFDSVLGTAAKLLAPDSLLADPTDLQLCPAEERKSAANAALLTQPGDIIMVTTPGSFYSFWRGITNNPHDHAAVVISGHEVMHIGPPKVRVLPLQRLLLPKRQPTIYRPMLSDEDRRKFIQHIKSICGSAYDIIRAYGLILRLSFDHLYGLRPLEPLPLNPKNRNSWICTDALLYYLSQSSENFKNAVRKASTKLDLYNHGGTSLRDFTTLKAEYPDLLVRVHLPASTFIVSPPRISNFGLSPLFTVLQNEFRNTVQRNEGLKKLSSNVKIQVLVSSIVLLALARRASVVVGICWRVLQLYFLKYVGSQLVYFAKPSMRRICSKL